MALKPQKKTNFAQMDIIIIVLGCCYPDGRLSWPGWEPFGTQTFTVKRSWDQGGFNFLLAALVALHSIYTAE